jgi:hypothetical protein
MDIGLLLETDCTVWLFYAVASSAHLLNRCAPPPYCITPDFLLVSNDSEELCGAGEEFACTALIERKMAPSLVGMTVQFRSSSMSGGTSQ